MAAGDGDKKTKARAPGGDDTPDHELWQRVAETIKPLRARRRRTPKVKPSAPLAAPEKPVKPRAIMPAAPAPAPAAKPATPALSTTATPGIDKRTAQRLGRGQLEIEARLDLHGLTQDEAHARLAGFIRRSAAAGKRCVLVITGKGFKPTGETGVLRQSVPRWLNEPEMRRAIVALRHAQPKDGGEGALYVLLRRDRDAVPLGKDGPPPSRLSRRRRES